MIEVSGLSKRYGKKEALKNVSFTIAEGEVVGLLGLNGAGKSTTMNILAGYIGATSGTARIAGLDVVADAREARRVVGYLPEQPPLYPDMTVEEYLRFVWRLYGVRRGGRDAAVARALERTSLTGVRGRLVRNLSKGYRQRVGIAQAILPSPRVLILDEPTIGLDPAQIIEVRALVADIARDATVILSSHILTEIQAVCARVLVLNEGRLIADSAPQELAGIVHGRQSVHVRVLGSREEGENALRGLQGITRLESLGQKEAGSHDFLLGGSAGRDVRVDAFRALAAAGLPILRISGDELSLEEAFHLLLQRDRERPA